MVFVLFLLVIIGLVAWIVLNSNNFIGPYLFFVRFPILLGLFIVFFPIIAITKAKEMLGNVFILSGTQITVAAFLLYFCVISIANNGFLIVKSAPYRTGLFFNRRVHESIARAGTSKLTKFCPRFMPNLDYKMYSPVFVALVCCLLFSPVGVLILRSEEEPLNAALYMMIGLGPAIALQYLYRRFLRDSNLFVNLFAQFLNNIPDYVKNVKSNAFKFLVDVGFSIFAPYEGNKIYYLKENNKLRKREWEKYLKLHIRAFGAATICLLIYVFFGMFTAPGLQFAEGFVSPFAYIIVILTLLTWLLGFLSFRYDNSRIPVLGFVIGFLMVLRFLVPNDHVYRIENEWRGHKHIDSSCAVDRRVEKAVLIKDDHALKRVVIIAASGGGITAAYWTSIVLEGLEKEFRESFPFNKNVVLVSGVSGGAVGLMYYLNTFKKEGRKKYDFVEQSGRSGLSAVSWGLAYPDLARVVLGDILGSNDRGRALERFWDREMGSRNTIGDWQQEVASGLRPTFLFSSTFEETGERFVLSPVRLKQSNGDYRHDFIGVFGEGKDIGISTAARLSATFPFVTPHARADYPKVCGHHVYHCADGGYFDNYGVQSALDVLDDWLKYGTVDNVEKIAFVEILAGERSGESEKPEAKERSFIASVSGPLKTLTEVRSTTQVARNEDRLDRVDVPEGVVFEPFLFQLIGDHPLSWHLTESEKADIEESWSNGIGDSGTNARVLNDLKDFLLSK